MSDAAIGETGLHVPAMPAKPRWRSPLVWAHLLAVTAPLQAQLVFNLFSLRAYQHLGHWPQPMLDDPKFIGVRDGLMDLLYELSGWMLLWAWVSIVPTPILAERTWGRYHPRWRTALVALFCLSYLALWFDPGGRVAWLLD